MEKKFNLKNNELISVIVPIYNVEKYLEKCILSIINQKYKNLEILLIDDGSTDNSGSIADKYSKKDKRIKVFHKKNGGLSDARNYGIDRATGKYLAFIDSDDYIDKNMYYELYNNLVKTKSDISICKRCIVYEDGTIDGVSLENDVILTFSRDDAMVELNFLTYFDCSACDKLYKKEMFDEIRFPIGKISEDAYTIYKVIFNAKKVVLTNNTLYCYFQRSNSISRNKRYSDALICASKEKVDFYLQNIPNLVYSAYIDLFYNYVILYDNIFLKNITVEKDFLKSLRTDAKPYFKYVLKCNRISLKKKFKGLIYIYCLPLYNLIIKKNLHTKFGANYY